MSEPWPTGARPPGLPRPSPWAGLPLGLPLGFPVPFLIKACIENRSFPNPGRPGALQGSLGLPDLLLGPACPPQGFPGLPSAFLIKGVYGQSTMSEPWLAWGPAGHPRLP